MLSSALKSSIEFGNLKSKLFQRKVKSYVSFVSCAGFALVVQALIAPPSYADASFVMHRKASGRVTNEMRMWVRGHQMRIGEVSGLKGYLIYDLKAQTITQVDEAEKVYRVIDEQTIAQLKATLKGLQSSVIAQLEGLPVEQREKMKVAMEQFSPTLGLKPIQQELKLREVDQTREVAGVSCQIIEQYVLREKVRELCVTSATSLGLLAEDVAVAKSFFDYVRQVADQLPGGQKLLDQMSLWNPLIEKVPLQVKRLQDGAVSSVYEMSNIDTRPVDAKLFLVPSGYGRADVL